MAEAYRAGELGLHLHPMNAALSQLTPVPVAEDEIKRLRNGQPIAGHAPSLTRDGYALSDDGAVVAILRPDAGQGRVVARQSVCRRVMTARASHDPIRR